MHDILLWKFITEHKEEIYKRVRHYILVVAQQVKEFPVSDVPQGAQSCLLERTERNGRNKLSFLRSCKCIWILTERHDSFADRNWHGPLYKVYGNKFFKFGGGGIAASFFLPAVLTVRPDACYAVRPEPCDCQKGTAQARWQWTLFFWGGGGIMGVEDYIKCNTISHCTVTQNSLSITN